MIPVAVIVVLCVLVVGMLRALGLRVVGARPRRKSIVVSHAGPSSVLLKDSPETSALGTHMLRFGQDFQQHATLGQVQSRADGTVTRAVSDCSVPLPDGSWSAIVSSYPPVTAHPLFPRITDVAIVASDGVELPAWYIEGTSGDWAIHVQGIRTSREVTLRSMEETVAAGMPTLSITYRGAGESSSSTPCSTLGQREWKDLLVAVDHARAHGARTITVVGWSMGAGIALELARRLPQSIDGMILIAPATNWTQIICHGATRAGLPGWVGGAVTWFVGTRPGAALLGLPEPLDMTRLNWSNAGDLRVRTLVIHSRGDGEIPYSLSEDFARAHGDWVQLVEFPAVPHAWEANTDPDRFASAFSEFLMPTAGSKDGQRVR